MPKQEIQGTVPSVNYGHPQKFTEEKTKLYTRCSN